MNHSNRRYVILGDPHISPEERALWREEIIPDINTLRPDRVLVLGDLTGGKWVGTEDGTREAVALFNGLDAPWASIIGNHDLQGAFGSDEAAVAMMMGTLGLERPSWVIEEEALAIIGLSNTYWRRNANCKNQIVIDAEQQAWLERELRRLGRKPVIILGHTPPVGSGLMVMAELHARIGNAYMNQDVNAGAIQELIWNHPNVLFWFSGHNHLGQHYRDAISRKLGVLYAHTGTASRISAGKRDGCRHSRVLEIGEDGFRLRTFDHMLRAVDPDLDDAGLCPLPDLVEERRRLLHRRFVPMDPRTMEQPAPATQRKGTRFLFLSDAHSIAPLAPIQQRVAGWCALHTRALMPDMVILGGDLTHRSLPEQARAFLEVYQVADRLVYLPGNNEGSTFEYPAGVEAVTACRKLEGAERVWLLPTVNRAQTAASVDTLLEELPAEGNALVFAHFPPEMAGEERVRKLAALPVAVHWLCGHNHQADEREMGNLRITVCAGLDPVKACGSRPEIVVADWDGVTLRCQRERVPTKVLNPPGRKPTHWAGIAFRGSAETLLRVALKREVAAIQFHYIHSRGAPSAEALGLSREYRRTVPGGFLSLHLPNFPRPEEKPNLAEMEPYLEFAEKIGVDDLTIHLPKVPARLLYDGKQNFQESDWVRGCLETYAALSARALKMGAQISFENVYNKVVSPPGGEGLGTQPWQLLRFVEEMRGRLRREGFSAEEVMWVGIIFDAGHAFADIQFSKYYGIADWLVQIAPYMQLSHIHQVRSTEDGKWKNHQTISDPHGSLINYEGVLCAFRDVTSRAFPLLAEVREQEAALKSYAILQRMQMLRGGAPDEAGTRQKVSSSAARETLINRPIKVV